MCAGRLTYTFKGEPSEILISVEHRVTQIAPMCLS